MNNTRFIIAIVLSFVVIFVWSKYYGPKKMPVTSTQSSTMQQPASPSAQTAPQNVADINVAAPAVAANSFETFTIKQYSFVISPIGGYIYEIQAKNEDAGLISKKTKVFPFTAVMLKNTGSVPDITDKYTLTQDNDEIIMEGPNFVKKIRETANGQFECSVEMTAKTSGGFLLILNNHLDKLEFKYLNKENQLKKIRKIKKTIPALADQQWVSAVSKYYLLAFQGPSKYIIRGEKNLKSIELLAKNNNVNFKMYVLPKKYSLVKKIGNGLEKTIFSGVMGYIALLLLQLLNIIYSIIPNYGWSIIVISVILKALLSPLSVKTVKSSAQMQKLQPLIAELKKKYKDNPKQMQVEQMKLYKEHKASPLGGCLPALVQLPIWWALFIMLKNAFELKDAPFIFWIHDLSAPDPLKILPILMGIAMYFQQKYTAATMDKSQASMMIIMPVVFTFISLSFPSGLVLYWFVSTLLGLVEYVLYHKK